MQNYVFVCDFAAKYAGNFIPCLSELVQALTHSNIYFLFPEQAKEKHWLKYLPVPRDHIVFSDFDPKSLSLCLKKLSSMLSPNQTIVHTHFIKNFQMLAVRLHFHNIVCHQHMSVPKLDSWHRRLRRLLNNIIYNKCILVGVSNAVTKDLQHYYPFNKCEYIKNAISFQSLDILSKQFPAPTYLGQETFNLLIHGTDFFTKGVDIAIHAVNAINRQNDTKCKLYITSHNTEECSAYVKQCTNNLENIEIINVIDGIKNLYDRIDCFLSPSRSEAFGYSVAEAAYSACQVIASNIPGQNTMIDIPGILWVESENISSLENAILAAIENTQNGLSLEIKCSQREYVQKNYNVSEWIVNILSLYQKYFL